MQCVYCRFQNSHDDHRCRRCGRRVDSAVAAPDTYEPVRYSGGNLAVAPQLKLVPPGEFEAPPESPVAAPTVTGRQQSLFLDDEGRKILEFPAPRKIPVKRTADSATRPRRRPQPVDPAQPSLDFLPVATHAPRTLRTMVEASIGCEAPVATPVHRLFASAIDGALVMIAFVAFLSTFLLSGGALAFDPVVLGTLGGALVLIAAFYGFCYALANGETSGFRWAELRLINFDGAILSRPERLKRYLWSCLMLPSVVSILWALVDEESLAMHDHASNSFPSPR